jgi:hypothetical protein
MGTLSTSGPEPQDLLRHHRSDDEVCVRARCGSGRPEELQAAVWTQHRLDWGAKDWAADGKPWKVNENVPVELDDGVTPEDEQQAEDNWAKMSPEKRAYVNKVAAEVDALLASLKPKT